jgi:hypothetical protein
MGLVHYKNRGRGDNKKKGRGANRLRRAISVTRPPLATS